MPQKSDTPLAAHLRPAIAGNTARISESLALAKRDDYFDVKWSWDRTVELRSRVKNAPKRKLRQSRQAFYDSI